MDHDNDPQDNDRVINLDDDPVQPQSSQFAQLQSPPQEPWTFTPPRDSATQAMNIPRRPILPSSNSFSGSFGQFTASPPPITYMQPPGLRRDRSISSPLVPRATPVTDIESQSRSTAVRHTASAFSRTRGGKDKWTVFGQLLEDDRTPGRRGSDTPTHTVSKGARISTTSIGMHPSVTVSSLASSLGQPIATSLTSASTQTIAPQVQVQTESNHSQTPPPSHQSIHDLEVQAQQTSPKTAPTFTMPPLTKLQRNILKCAFAYFLGSLFTFVPYLSGFLSDIVPAGGSAGPSPSGHMVATIAVYYNPAKTIGAMFEADVYCLMAATFSAVVCLVSMSLFWLLEEKPGYEWLADVLVFLCLGLAMSFVAWMKLWMAKPSFNTACSMTAIIIFIVAVKEGGPQALMHVTFIVLIGSIISNTICFLIWPESATSNLQATMIKVVESFATVLEMTTQSFLLQDSTSIPRDKLLQAVEEHQSSFVVLKRCLHEARSEWLDQRMKVGTNQAMYDDAVESLTRLAQHLNGLRDGVRQRSEIVNAKSSNGMLLTPAKQVGTELTSIRGSSVDLPEDVCTALKTLSEHCEYALKKLVTTFVTHERNSGATATSTSDNFNGLTENIRTALKLFGILSNKAVVESFRTNAQQAAQSGDKSNKGFFWNRPPVTENKEEESILCLYFFLFTLQEFSEELMELIEIMKVIHNAEKRLVVANKETVFSRLRRRFMCCLPGSRSRLHYAPLAIFEDRKPRIRPALKRRISSLIPIEPKPPFPRVRPHARNTLQTPSMATLSFAGRIKQSIWALGARLKESDIRYAVKTGMATAMLATPAFVDATRPFFMEYRGEWALISFFVVMSPTIGATNFLSFHRIFGTLLGATTAASIYTLFPDNPYVLSIFGFFFSIPCFYYIVGTPKYATSGRFVLLTYNLTALFCYNLRDLPSVDPIVIAFHRSTSVIVGVVWALIVSRWWWPSEARRELGRALSAYCLNLGWLYSQLVETYSVPPEVLNCRPNTLNTSSHPSFGAQSSNSENAPLLPAAASNHLSNSIRHFMAMELHLQIKLIELQDLLAQTQNEPRLKGPFPVHLYRTMLTSLQIILDKLHTMRCVTTKEEWYITVRSSFIIPVNPQRREMVGNILLYFSTLASAFATKRALPPYLPPAEDARLRLVNAIKELEVVKKRNVESSSHLLYFAYALTMKGVIQELDFLGQTLQDAFGVIGHSRADFEALFQANEGLEAHAA